MNKWLIILLLLLATPHFAISQDKKIDLLEVLYSQQHFTKVQRKANKLLAIPDYDYSGMPTFYKSLATFKLLADPDWSRKNTNGLSEAIALYDAFLLHPKKASYIQSHYFEIAELKQFLIDLEKQFELQKKNADAKQVSAFVETQLKNITAYGIKTVPPAISKENQKGKGAKSKPDNKPLNKVSTVKAANENIREEMVVFAAQFEGTPYKWAGNTPKGFDCSGFVGYVYNNYGIVVPRTAGAQNLIATPIKDSEAMKGDLVFFKSGSKITHVGIVISEVGDPLTMVHSSTSKGIIKTNVHASSYWSKKYAGIGRIIE